MTGGLVRQSIGDRSPIGYRTPTEPVDHG